MPITPNAFNVTTGLIAAGACWMIYLLIKNQIESNLPLLYFVGVVAYVNILEGRLAPGIVYGGLVLALLIRFEFMNTFFLEITKTLELLVLSIIVYECTAAILLL